MGSPYRSSHIVREIQGKSSAYSLNHYFRLERELRVEHVFRPLEVLESIPAVPRTSYLAVSEEHWPQPWELELQLEQALRLLLG